jgi:hypothetical protein
MSDESTMGRRGLILGAGALAAAGVTGSAEAAPAPGPTAAGSGVAESPVAGTLGSAPVSGYTYHHASMFDFTAESGAAQRSWGGHGVWATGSILWASIEIPSGARIRDVEWYVLNTSGNPVTAMARLWAAGTGGLGSSVINATIPSGAEVIQRVRVVPTATTYGPYPLGCKLNVGLFSADESVQINGARVGFEVGNGRTGLMSTPVRAYDSRLTGGKLASGETRVITLPPTIVLPGVTGALLNITAHSAVASGWLKVYPGHGAVPGASALNYLPGQTIANAMIVGVSSARQIKIYAHKSVHVMVDINGTIA